MDSGAGVFPPGSGYKTGQVDLFEEGIENTGKDAQYNDPYSVALAPSGPRRLMTLRYRYDSAKKIFERVE
jgi:hypothetical protein